MSRDRQHPAALRAASKSDKALRTRRLRAMTPDLPFWEWFKPSNWAAIAQADTALAPPPSAPPALQRPLAEFGHELQAALEQAYFGPPLDHLAAGELPVAFEAEHRTLPDMGSLLQIVSGQTVLGEVQVHMLPQLNSDVAPQLDYSRAAPHDAGSKNDSDAFSAASLRTASMQGRFEDCEAELHFSLRALRKGLGDDASWLEIKDEQDATQAFVLNDMLADADGRHTHTVLEASTPAVLHTTILSMAARKVVCKATRAWAPPPELRVFPVRDHRYSSGGYYVEWAGHHQEGRQGWLHPGIVCLLLGFRALELEAGRKQPWWFTSMARRLLQLR